MAKAKARAQSAARKAGAKRTKRSKKCTGANCKKPWVGMAEFARKRGFTVKSTTDGKHNPGSAHYEGRAIDVRTRDKSPAQVDAFIKDARANGISVRDERTHPPGQGVWNGPHLHLSVPRGTSFPPCCK